MKTLLVFGSDGWLGNSLIDQIKNLYLKKYNIDNLFLQTYSKKNRDEITNNSKLNIINFSTDFKVKSSFNSLKKVLKKFKNDDIYVIFITGIIHPLKFEDFNIINYKSLRIIYELLEDFKLKKFTYISSNSPFGFNKNKKTFNEKTKFNPYGGYGISKMKAEKYLLNKDQTDIITILRAPWFHGKYMPERQRNFLKSASKGLFPLINSGKNIRSIVNVKDLAKASILVTFERRKHKIYWICEKNKSMFKIVQIIKQGSKRLGKKANLKWNIIFPFGFSSIFFIIDIAIQKLKIYNMYIHVFSEIGQDIFADNSLYMKEFADKHTFTPLEDSIMEELKEIY